MAGQPAQFASRENDCTAVAFRNVIYEDLVFFLSAQRAFAKADNFFLAAALIERRPVDFFGVALAVLGADLPFHFAQRCFIAVEIRLRAAALMRRRF